MTTAAHIDIVSVSIGRAMDAVESSRVEAASAERPDVAALLTRALATLQASKVALLRRPAVEKGSAT